MMVGHPLAALHRMVAVQEAEIRWMIDGRGQSGARGQIGGGGGECSHGGGGDGDGDRSRSRGRGRGGGVGGGGGGGNQGAGRRIGGGADTIESYGSAEVSDDT